MTQQGLDRAAERYRLVDMLSAVPKDRSTLLMGFTPWEQDVDRWANSVRRARPTALGGPRVSRTVWDDPGERMARVLIDVHECDSAEQAVRELVLVLAGNELADVPSGPEQVGLVSYRQPADLPPAVMFVRANLCLVVASFGTVNVDVVPWALRLDGRIQERPELAEEADMLGEDTRDDAGDRVLIPVTPPWVVGEGGYVKLFSEGGTLEMSDDLVAVRGEGAVNVEAYVVEPGRPTYRSQRRITTR